MFASVHCAQEAGTVYQQDADNHYTAQFSELLLLAQIQYRVLQCLMEYDARIRLA